MLISFSIVWLKFGGSFKQSNVLNFIYTAWVIFYEWEGRCVCVGGGGGWWNLVDIEFLSVLPITTRYTCFSRLPNILLAVQVNILLSRYWAFVISSPSVVCTYRPCCVGSTPGLHDLSAWGDPVVLQGRVMSRPCSTVRMSLPEPCIVGAAEKM